MTADQPVPRVIRRLRRLFLGLAALDAAALLLFIGVAATDRSTVESWVASAPIYAGMIRDEGLSGTVTYAIVSTAVIHVVITAILLRLAMTIDRGSRTTRVRATIVLVVSGAFNAIAATSPVGGYVQLVVMLVSVVLKLAALVLLWQPTKRAYDGGLRPSPG